MGGRMSAFKGSRSEPIFNLPPMTGALILTNLAVEVIRQLLPDPVDYDLIVRFGFIPVVYRQPLGLDQLLAPLTYQFLHGGWLHLGVNMVTLAAFGAGIERWLGPYRMLAYYLICGVIAAGVHYLTCDDPTIPVIGASGAISGLFGGILILLRRQRGGGLLLMAGLWIAMTVTFGFVALPGTDDAPIAWQAHIGGFLAGMALIHLFEPRRFRG